MGANGVVQSSSREENSKSKVQAKKGGQVRLVRDPIMFGLIDDVAGHTIEMLDDSRLMY